MPKKKSITTRKFALNSWLAGISLNEAVNGCKEKWRKDVFKRVYDKLNLQETTAKTEWDKAGINLAQTEKGKEK